MIKNEKQYRMTKKTLEGWELTRQQLLHNRLPNTPNWLYEEQVFSAKEQIRQLKSQLKEYEDTKTGKKKLPALTIVNDIPSLLVQWRIARNLTQRDLATKLGIHENQIQRYENTNYSGASLSTVGQIANILINYNRKTKHLA